MGNSSVGDIDAHGGFVDAAGNERRGWFVPAPVGFARTEEVGEPRSSTGGSSSRSRSSSIRTLAPSIGDHMYKAAVPGTRFTDVTKRNRLTEDEGQARAGVFLRRLIGAAPTDLCWDETHHLQGHAHVGDRELVVIAPRDKVHETVVLTAEDWDEVRHASGELAGEMVRRRAIHDHDSLLAIVG